MPASVSSVKRSAAIFPIGGYRYTVFSLPVIRSTGEVGKYSLRMLRH